MANSIRETYKNTNVRVNGQVVEVKFNNYLVEVLPCFKMESGSYKYPDSNNGGFWDYCNPLAEKEAVTKKNDDKNKNLKRLCKMVRAWKNEHGVPMNGLLIDTLCYNFFSSTSKYDEKSYSSYRELVRDFFSYIVDEGEDKEFWRAPGSRSPVYNKKGKFIPKSKKALRKCNEAVEDQSIAINNLRSVFGRRFPSSVGVAKSLVVATEDRGFKDTEEFIEDKFSVDISLPLEIDCEVKEGNSITALLRLVEGSRISKGRKLGFYVKNIDDFDRMDVDIYWKVRNVGYEAERRDLIRGQIRHGSRNGRRNESTDFEGDHFVECYIVNNGVCVARDLIKVNI